MYRYDEFDHQLVNERVAQFRRQVHRRLVGEITEDQFKPLRLMNGLYLQLHAYMLRVNVPYGTNSHHIAEAIFKALGQALATAVRIVGTDVPSTKGML